MPQRKPPSLKALEQAAWAYVRLELAKLKIDPPMMSITSMSRYKTLRGFFASPKGKKYSQECQRLHDQFWRRVLVAYTDRAIKSGA